VTADDTGTVVTTVTVPATLLAGAHTVTLTSPSDTVAFAFVIAAPTSGTGSGTGSGSSNGLPHTGGDSAPVGLLALGLIGLGAAIVLVARRGLVFARI
jgi:LPXTG-motif cell wall-anchored protein